MNKTGTPNMASSNSQDIILAILFALCLCTCGTVHYIDSTVESVPTTPVTPGAIEACKVACTHGVDYVTGEKCSCRL